MVIEPLPNANAAAKCLLKNPQRVKKSTEKVGPFEALVNLRLRRWDTSSGASVLLRYVKFRGVALSGEIIAKGCLVSFFSIAILNAYYNHDNTIHFLNRNLKCLL